MNTLILADKIAVFKELIYLIFILKNLRLVVSLQGVRARTGHPLEIVDHQPPKHFYL